MDSTNELMAVEPNVLPDVAEYWNGANRGKLLIKTCMDCCRNHFYPRAICPHCLSANTAWIEASGKGWIYSYSTMGEGALSYTLAYITLEEGVTMMSNLVQCELKTISIGQPVKVVFGRSATGQAVPLFTSSDVPMMQPS